MNQQSPNNNDRDPLGLSALPEMAPDEDRWAQIRAGLETSPSSAGADEDAGQRLWPLALAAALGLAISLPWLLPSDPVGGNDLPDSRLAQQAAEPTGTVIPAMTHGSVDLDDLQRQSRILAAALRASRQYDAALSGEAAIYAVELEDTIAQMDQALAENPESRTLWRGRVGLMTDLLAVYRKGDTVTDSLMI